MNIIETKNLVKKYGDFVANDNINMSVKKGEIRAIIGENGAGKTTLMNMLYGINPPTSGEILLYGKPVELKSPKEAIELGIGMVHQHFKLVPSFTVFENIALGMETVRTHKFGKTEIQSIFIDVKSEKKAIADLIKKYNFKLNINDRIRDISVGSRQQVEILKMLYRDIDILILDEPTAVLIPQEIDELLNELKELKKSGKTIIIITHKLAEVKLCADSISVMRRGELIGTVPNDDKTSQADLAEMMVGRKVLLRVQKSKKTCGKKAIYSVKNLKGKDKTGRFVVDDVSFDIHENEILAVAGIEGNGQSELMMMLSGLMKFDSGKVFIDGCDISEAWPSKLREKGVGIVPEDRYIQGLCRDLKVSYNLVSGYHNTKQFCNHGFMRKKAIMDNMAKQVECFDIRLSSPDPLVSELSGGNAQKIIIAREFGQEPKVLLASQTTRGLDIGATEFVHKTLIKSRDEGKAILLISSDLSEITGLSDRIIVMYRGKIVGEFNSDEVTQRELGLYMSGAKTMEIQNDASCQY